MHDVHRAIEGIATADFTGHQRGEGVLMLLQTRHDGRLAFHGISAFLSIFFLECPSCLTFVLLGGLGLVFLVIVDDDLHSLGFDEFFACS